MSFKPRATFFSIGRNHYEAQNWKEKEFQKICSRIIMNHIVPQIQGKLCYGERCEPSFSTIGVAPIDLK